MGIFNEFNKKEKPVFTGSRFGFGAGDRPTAAGGTSANSVIASGGSVQSYTDGSTTYRVHIFANGDSDFVYTSGPGSIDVMVMGGGGGGGGSYGDQDAGKGGGGSGGLAWASAIPISPGTTCPITVGDGGRGHYGADPGADRQGRRGSNSVFVIPSGPYTITGAGGGGGGASDASGSYPVAPNRVPSINTCSGEPGGSGGGSGARGSGDGNYNGGPATQPGLNPGMPWVTNFGNAGGDGSSGPSSGGGGGGGTHGSGSAQSSADGGNGGQGKDNFVGPIAEQKSFLLATKGLGMNSTNPHGYATPSNNNVYFGGGGAGSPGTSGSNFSAPLALGGLGGGGRAGLGRNIQQNSPNLNTTLPTAYWYQIGGANHHGGGGGAAADDPKGDGNPSPNRRRTSAGFGGRGGQGVVVVRYEIVEVDATTFVAATGGTTSTDGDYKVHKFDGSGTSNTPGTFTITQKSDDPKLNTIEVLVVGGGGSGGKWSGGGGGGGGVAHTYNYSLDHPAFPGSGPWAVPLQAGGGGGAQTSNGVGNTGGDSYFGPTSLRLLGMAGGGGGTSLSISPLPNTTYNSMDGGSGGGGAHQNVNQRAGVGHQKDIFGSDPGWAGWSNRIQHNAKILAYQYGHSGGQANQNSDTDMGGGGGAGGTGSDGGPGNTYSSGQGHGGPGIAISITGSPVVYGGGGTGASPPSSEAGGPGGGGQGGGGSADGGAGTDGLGGGGGGTYSGSPQSGQGGAGTVIVRYKYQ